MGERDTTVLVVEDERDLADTFARWLSDEYAVRTAYTGEEALELLDDDVDVVLLDRRLPGMTGGEVLDVIRVRGYDCRVAMITAVDPGVDILEMPFDDYVVKPVLEDDLRDIVQGMRKRATVGEQLRESAALAATLSVLESELPASDLHGNEEYEEATARLDALKEEIDTSLAEFEGTDFASTYRDIDESDEGSA